MTGTTMLELTVLLALFDSAIAQTITSEALIDRVADIFGFGVLAAVTAACTAFAFRWYSADAVPDGVAILLGISPVALLLNTQTVLYQEIVAETALFTVVAFAASAIAADGGRRVGDYLAQDVFSITAPRTVTEVSQLVRSAGRVIAVDLPEEIDDLEGYDPVDDATKEALAGQTFLLPRRLTTEQLRERLLDRLEDDYGIGHADIGFTDMNKKTIEYVAVGSRPAGIGPTLAPGSVAVAIRGDPAPDASPGDAVRIWQQTAEGTRRLAEGELRGTAGDVVTVAVDDDDASALTTDGQGQYRVVTRPGVPSTERELVSLLRAADDTVTTLTVEPNGALEGVPIGSIPVLVLVLERGRGSDRERETKRNRTADRSTRDSAGGDLVALPADDTVLEAGDTAYVLGRPDALRRLADRDQRDEPDGSRGRADADPDSSRNPGTVSQTER